jgi:hypothetical protein
VVHEPSTHPTDWSLVFSGRTAVVVGAMGTALAAFYVALLNPDLGESFLAGRLQFNVLRPLGISDQQFVLLGGVVEGSIGALLVSGLLTRVVILSMWVPFNLTVPFLPAVEMIGHLPIFGVMYLLLVYGAGSAQGRVEPAPSAAGAAS